MAQINPPGRGRQSWDGGAPVAQASSPAGSGGVSPPLHGTRTKTVLEPAAEDGCATQWSGGQQDAPMARGARDGRAPLIGGQSDQHPQLAAQGDALWVTDPRSGGAFRRWGAIRHPSLVLFRVFRGLKPSVPLCLRGDMALPPPF